MPSTEGLPLLYGMADSGCVRLQTVQVVQQLLHNLLLAGNMGAVRAVDDVDPLAFYYLYAVAVVDFIVSCQAFRLLDAVGLHHGKLGFHGRERLEEAEEVVSAGVKIGVGHVDREEVGLVFQQEVEAEQAPARPQIPSMLHDSLHSVEGPLTKRLAQAGGSQGKNVVVEQGKPEDVFDHPKNERTAQFLGSIG